jgi:hypothetical protein
MRLWVVAIAMIFAAGPALAQSAEGSSALALGAIVGSVSPVLGASQKRVLAEVFKGDRASAARASKISIKADRILCHAGDVDITAFGCDLTFGSQTVHLSGRSANELYATLGDAGVADDGAAGTIYRGVYKLSCTIDPPTIFQSAGGGADCAYTLN